jgi:hypothetical protein
MYGTSAKRENTQTAFKASGSADIKSHELSFGFEFEQRKDYYWGIGPMGLWSLMRQQANKHILERDLLNPDPVFDANGIYQDTINYDRLFIASEQSDFDREFRISQGLNPEGLDFIDIDSYTPDQFSLDMFSADELLNNGSSLIYYHKHHTHNNKLMMSHYLITHPH